MRWLHVPLAAVVVLAAATLAVGVPGVLDAAPNAPDLSPDNDHTAAEYERAIHNRTNIARSLHRESELTWHPDAAAVARNHSRDMAANGYVGHTNPGGDGPQTRLERAGVDCVATGENIAARENDAAREPDALAEQIVSQWLRSPGHRKNLYRSEWTAEGIGVYREGLDVWVTQVFCR